MNFQNYMQLELKPELNENIIKGGPSHNELVRRAERMIYSAANLQVCRDHENKRRENKIEVRVKESKWLVVIYLIV